MKSNDNPIRLGLVGLNFGHHVVDMLMADKDLPVKLTHVCDLDREKAEKCAADYGLIVANSLDDMLTDPAIDAIGLYTGPSGRAGLIRQIINAGKDVMTTKPFEIDPQAGLAVLEEAKSLGRVVHLNSPNMRPFGEMAIIKRWIDSGAIGRPVLAQSNVWAYYGPTPADGTWYDDPARCPVAPIFRLGIYPLNGLLTIFDTPKSVQVTHARIETHRPTPDNASVTIGFADGGIINIMASFVVGGPDMYKNALTIGGTKGVIYYHTGPKSQDDHPVSHITLSTDDGVTEEIIHYRAGEYDWEFFAQRVRGEVSEDITTPAQIVAAITVMQAMSVAEQTGQVVYL